MSGFAGILLLSLMVLSFNLAQAKDGGNKLAICLLDFHALAGDELSYVIKSINAAIANRLSQFPVTVYTGDSAPARYFGNPDKILESDKENSLILLVWAWGVSVMRPLII